MIDVIVAYASVALGILACFGIVALVLIVLVFGDIAIDVFISPNYNDDLEFEEVDYEKV